MWRTISRLIRGPHNDVIYGIKSGQRGGGAVVLTARERAAEAGAAALRPFASVLSCSDSPALPPCSGNHLPLKVHLVEAQRGPRGEHKVVTAMDKTGRLECGKRIDHFEPAADL